MNKTIDIKVWSGSRSARITEMVNAGKRGKMCRVVRVNGIQFHGSRENAVAMAAEQATCEAMHAVVSLSGSESFDMVVITLKAIEVAAVAQGVPAGYFSVEEDEIKGIKAPRPVLTAGVDGKWTASANESGISMRRLDDVNEWSEITHRQTGAAAYAAAAKVWGQVQDAATMHEATEILRAAGARLHGYCAMD